MKMGRLSVQSSDDGDRAIRRIVGGEPPDNTAAEG
jgi:hypothetical protein